jgi:CheY-like chemotaxis protein
MLELMGGEVRTAQDGNQAIHLAETFRPDLVLLDLGLPGLSGHDTARMIRQAEWGKSMCLVALTGRSQDEDKQQSAAAGFDLHLVKPAEPAALEKLLKS